MKRLMLVAIAAASLATPLALAGPAAAQGHHDRGGHYDRGGRHDGDRGDNGRWDNRGDNGRWDNRGDNRRWDNRGNNGRWDQARHNGYYYNNRWSYGPPPQAYYGRPSYRPGYTSWRRGAYLPPYYRDRSYVVYDYGRYHLRPPPRGYYWYRSGNDYLLAAIATGLIFDVIANDGY